jgi:hypothetical protein
VLRKKGLFATRDYNAKEVVTLYLGKHLTYEEAKVTEDSRYLAQFNGHLVIDGKEGWQGDHGLGRFCNGAPKDSKPSVSFHPYYEEKSATPILRVVAKRAIKRGQEITAVYGKHLSITIETLMTPPPFLFHREYLLHEKQH